MPARGAGGAEGGERDPSPAAPAVPEACVQVQGELPVHLQKPLLSHLAHALIPAGWPLALPLPLPPLPQSPARGSGALDTLDCKEGKRASARTSPKRSQAQPV